MIDIRKATVKDAQHIALLGRITFTETFSEYFRNKQDLFDYYEQTFNVSKIKDSIQKENNCYWIAFWNELPVGYAKLKINSTTEFHKDKNSSQLQKIYVLKEFLNKKIGMQLMNELMKYFNQSSKNHLWLSVLKTNDKALSFYAQYNFKQVDEHFFQIGKETFDFYVLSHKKSVS